MYRSLTDNCHSSEEERRSRFASASSQFLAHTSLDLGQSDSFFSTSSASPPLHEHLQRAGSSGNVGECWQRQQRSADAIIVAVAMKARIQDNDKG